MTTLAPTVDPSLSGPAALGSYSKSPRGSQAAAGGALAGEPAGLLQVQLGTQAFTLQPNLPYVVGSGPTANIEVSDPSLPERAATILNDQIVVHAGPIGLNGRQLPASAQAVQLRDGDQLQCGTALMTLRRLTHHPATTQTAHETAASTTIQQAPLAHGGIVSGVPEKDVHVDSTTTEKTWLPTHQQTTTAAATQGVVHELGSHMIGSHRLHRGTGAPTTHNTTQQLNNVSYEPSQQQATTLQQGSTITGTTTGVTGPVSTHTTGDTVVPTHEVAPFAVPSGSGPRFQDSFRHFAEKELVHTHGPSAAGLPAAPLTTQAQTQQAAPMVAQNISTAGAVTQAVHSAGHPTAHPVGSHQGHHLLGAGCAPPTGPALPPNGGQARHLLGANCAPPIGPANAPLAAPIASATHASDSALYTTADLVQIFRDMVDLGGLRLAPDASPALTMQLGLLPASIRYGLGSSELKAWLRLAEAERQRRAAQPQVVRDVKQHWYAPPDAISEGDLALGLLALTAEPAEAHLRPMVEARQAISSAGAGAGTAAAPLTPRFSAAQLSTLLTDLSDVSGHTLEPGVAAQAPVWLQSFGPGYRSLWDSKEVRGWIVRAEEMRRERERASMAAAAAAGVGGAGQIAGGAGSGGAITSGGAPMQSSGIPASTTLAHGAGEPRLLRELDLLYALIGLPWHTHPMAGSSTASSSLAGSTTTLPASGATTAAHGPAATVMGQGVPAQTATTVQQGQTHGHAAGGGIIHKIANAVTGHHTSPGKAKGHQRTSYY